MRARGPLTALTVTLAAAGAAVLAGHVAAGARVRPVDSVSTVSAKPRVTRIDDLAVVFDTASGRVGVAISPDGRTLYVSSGSGNTVAALGARDDAGNAKTEVKLYVENGADSSEPAPARR